jgi:DNA-binding transcriptional regulator of glucitol operon
MLRIQAYQITVVVVVVVLMLLLVQDQMERDQRVVMVEPVRL